MPPTEKYTQLMNEMTMEQARKAQRLAVAAHNGKVLTDTERNLINQAVDYMSPENFYMDGELFASY